MSRFEFSMAGAADDAAIRKRFAEDRMPGEVSVTFRREPSFFAGLDLMGDETQVIKCNDKMNGTMVGFSSRYVRRFFWQGQPIRGGYLADLRCEPAYRGRGLLARGYKFLKDLHTESPLPVYYTMIYTGNDAAEKNLTGGRGGLPDYIDRGKFLTPAIHLDFRMPALSLPGLRVRPGRNEDLPSIIKFLNHENSRKQFAPFYEPEMFQALIRHGFKLSDLYLAECGREIVGTAAVFDAAGFRQTCVEQYSKRLAMIRPLYNAASFLSPLKPLPAVGDSIPCFYVMMPATRGNDPDIMRMLLRSIYRTRRTGPWQYFIAGFHERDPLASCLFEYRSIPASGRLYEISYDDNNAGYQEILPECIPYVEPLCL